MTTAVTLQLTFDGVRGEQIEQRWLSDVGGLEAYVFDGTDLAEEEGWRRLEGNLRTLSDAGAPRLTMHFPTENADWVNDRRSFDTLLRFCDLAAATGVDGIVLHANQFVQQDAWLDFDVRAARERVVARLAKLDEYMVGMPAWIGVENLPIIGSEGVDYDSVFVQPDDYLPLLELKSDRIGATWDVCHWAVTWTTLAAIGQLRQHPAPLPPLALPPLPIRQIHFASFTGHAMPFWPNACVEGVPPQQGDIDPARLGEMLLAAVDAAPGEVGIVFEVQEADYTRRVNCWQTLDWFDSVPELKPLRRRPAGGQGD
jgi:sugar phosphate isomerase/epimerase